MFFCNVNNNNVDNNVSDNNSSKVIVILKLFTMCYIYYKYLIYNKNNYYFFLKKSYLMTQQIDPRARYGKNSTITASLSTTSSITNSLLLADRGCMSNGVDQGIFFLNFYCFYKI
jgi:hypothetical protein